MLTFDLAWHLIALAVATTALLAAGHRVGARLFEDVFVRFATAATLAGTAAIAEALVFGTFGQGASTGWLLCGAIATWLVVRLAVPAPPTGSLAFIAEEWKKAALASRSFVGGLVTLGGLGLWHMLAHPVVGADGLFYHLTEPEVWVANGHPGSMHPILAGLPVEAYPRTLEVLDTWVLGLARTTSAAELVGPAFIALAVIALIGGLRALKVDTWLAAVAATTFVLTPMVFDQANGYYTDLPATVWLIACAMFVVCARKQPSALPLAIITSGLAVGTKTTTGPIAVALLIAALWWTRDRFMRMLPSVVAGTVAGLGVGVIWFGYNAIRYHAPLYPFSGAPGSREVPSLISDLGASFLSTPSATVHAVTRHGYVTNLAGYLLVMVGLVLAAVAAVLGRRRHSPKIAVGGLVVIAVLTLIWSASNFTGYAGIGYLSVAGLRYLMPVCAAAVWVLALVSRDDGTQRVVVSLTFAAAIVFDLWELRLSPTPFHPSTVLCIGFFAIGFAAIGHIDARWLPHAKAVGLLALLPLVVVANHRFDTNHPAAVAAVTGGNNDASLLPWIDEQPGWEHGHAVVTMGPEVLATMAGPRLTHPLAFLPQDASCASVRHAATTGWLLLLPNAVLGDTSYASVVSCLATLTPVHVSPDGWQIYAPAGFVSDGTPNDAQR